MMPFLGIGADQLADSCVGEPPKVAKVKFKGDDGTRKSIHIKYKLTISCGDYNVFAALYSNYDVNLQA